MTKVGIIGAGVMGLCIAKKLASANYEVTVYDVNPEACARAESI
jgi:3-hydroxyisobutyrate dehydrogenase-like beta-hydroxyacid dehydrogenase